MKMAACSALRRLMHINRRCERQQRCFTILTNRKTLQQQHQLLLQRCNWPLEATATRFEATQAQAKYADSYVLQTLTYYFDEKQGRPPSRMTRLDTSLHFQHTRLQEAIKTSNLQAALEVKEELLALPELQIAKVLNLLLKIASDHGRIDVMLELLERAVEEGYLLPKADVYLLLRAALKAGMSTIAEQVLIVCATAVCYSPTLCTAVGAAFCTEHTVNTCLERGIIFT
jgi:hypothetical protein